MNNKNRELKISTAHSKTSANWANAYTTLQDLTEKAYDPIVINVTQDEYFALEKREKDAKKDVGGFVGGHLKAGRRRKGHILARSLITLDLDNLPADIDLPAVLADTLDVAWLAHTTMSHRPGNQRWRLWVWLSRDVTPDEYEALGRRAAQDINPGLDWFDPTTFQPERFMYWPATTTDGDYQAHVSSGKPDLDPDTWLTRFADWRDLTTWPGLTHDDAARHERATVSSGQYQDPRAKPGMIGAFNRAYSIQSAITAFLPDIYKPGTMKDRFTYTGGTSTNGLIVYDAGQIAFSQHATDPAREQRCTAFDLVRIHHYGHLDADTPDTTPINKLPSYTAMTDMVADDPKTRRENAAATISKMHEVFAPISPTEDTSEGAGGDETVLEEHGQDDTTEPAGEEGNNTDWVAELDVTKSGEFRDSFENFLLIFTHDPRYNHISWNAHANTLAVQDPQALPWKQIKPGWSETDLAQLKQSISNSYKGLYGPTKMHDALMAAAATRAFHPVRDYFATLPTWDGIPRLDTLLVDYLGADDTPYTHAVTRKTLVAAVRRTHQPGTKFDQVLTLVGPQGIGKSTILARLAGQWFSDNLSITDMKDNKTAAEKLSGNLIIEIAELAGMRKAEAETVKSFISRTEDKYRPAYGRVVETYPRECIITASTNATDGFLRDPTGNRRWWAVPVTGHGLSTAHTMTQATIDQIWAEAKHHEAEGEPLWLEGQVADAAAQAQADAAEHDDRTGIVADFLDRTLPGNWDMLPLPARRAYLADGIIPAEHADAGTWATAGPRETVSKIEIWAECFGRDPDAMRRQDSYEIAAIMAQINGWEDSGVRHRQPIYGRQRVYSRTLDRAAWVAQK